MTLKRALQKAYDGSMNNRSCFYAHGKKLGKMTFCSSVIVSVIFSACQNGFAPGERTFPKSSEQQRITSPNGRFDAVLVTDAYGPAAGGGVDSNVYIAEKDLRFVPNLAARSSVETPWPVHNWSGRETISLKFITALHISADFETCGVCTR